MPDDDARKQSGERLAADLRALREERDLSVDDLREKLRVPSGLFEAFESGRLLSHPMFNRVYLRSLTRSYADAAGVPSAPALSALDATLNGAYEEGQLQREIDAHEPPPGKEPVRAKQGADTEQDDSAVDAAAGGTGAAAASEGSDENAPDWSTQSPPGASAAEAERRQREKEEHAQQREQEREERARQQQAQRQQREEHSRSAERGASEDRPARRREGRHQRRRQRSGSNAGRWILGILALVAVGVIAFFLLRSPGAGSETQQAAATVTDTAAGGEQDAQQQDQRPPANLQLDETMNFTVVAQDGPVQDLKVTRDQDVRRPYWIEQGQATVFPARERIILENPPEGEPTLQNVRLLAEGYPYPTDQRDPQGRIVITRQDMQAFADTLRGQPAQITAQRDTASLFGAQQ